MSGPQFLGYHEAGSPQWHATRLQGLGGSDIAAVLGISKWESAYSLHYRKRGLLPDPEANTDMEWGNRLEPVVLAKFSDEHPEWEVDTKPGTWCSGERPWQLGNPDAFLHHADPAANAAHARGGACHALLEAKTARYDYEWGTPGTDEIPPYYLAQTRWYLDVFGVDTCYVAVLIGGSDYREYVVHPDAQDTATLREWGAAFWTAVQAGEAPEIDGSEHTYTAVRWLVEGVDEGPVEVPRELAARWLAAGPAKDAAVAEHRQAGALLLEAIGTFQYATVGNLKVATRVVRKADGHTHSLRRPNTVPDLTTPATPTEGEPTDG